MTPEENKRNYRSHAWKSQRMGGPPDMAESTEHVCYCDLCGAENRGDPDEFPDLRYELCGTETE